MKHERLRLRPCSKNGPGRNVEVPGFKLNMTNKHGLRRAAQGEMGGRARRERVEWAILREIRKMREGKVDKQRRGGGLRRRNLRNAFFRHIANL